MRVGVLGPLEHRPARAFTYLGSLAAQLGDLDGGVENAERGLALALASGDAWQAALSTALLAFALDAAGRHQRVPALLEDSRARYDATGDPRADWGVAGCQLQAAMGAVRAGDVEVVERANRELLTRAGRLGDPVFATWSRLLAGWVAERRGRPRSAADQYRAALDLTRPLGASPYVAFVLALLGRLAMRAGELDRARSLQGEAAAMVDPARSPWFASFTHHSLAVTLRRVGELDAAAALHRQAVAESRAVEANFARELLFIALVGSPAARSLVALGALARSRGDPAEAERLLGEGLERARREADAEAVALALEALAATGDAARAATLLGAAESVRDTARAPRDRFEAHDAEQAKAAARSVLGPQALDQLVARGRGLALEQVSPPPAGPDAPAPTPAPSGRARPAPPARPMAPPARPVAPPARPVAPPARPVAPPARPVAPPARPVAPPARPVAPPARPVAPAGPTGGTRQPDRWHRRGSGNRAGWHARGSASRHGRAEVSQAMDDLDRAANEAAAEPD